VGEAPDNTFIDTYFGDKEATDAAFARADHMVRGEFHLQRVTAVTMEPRAAVGHYDKDTGRYTLYAGSGRRRAARSMRWQRSSRRAGEAARAVP
jgi:carbon-monoxide dehydrogenase large subunit